MTATTTPALRKPPFRQSHLKMRIIAALKAEKAKSDRDEPAGLDEFARGWDEGFIAAIKFVESFK